MPYLQHCVPGTCLHIRLLRNNPVWLFTWESQLNASGWRYDMWLFLLPGNNTFTSFNRERGEGSADFFSITFNLLPISYYNIRRYIERGQIDGKINRYRKIERWVPYFLLCPLLLLWRKIFCWNLTVKMHNQLSNLLCTHGSHSEIFWLIVNWIGRQDSFSFLIFFLPKYSASSARQESRVIPFPLLC